MAQTAFARMDGKKHNEFVRDIEGDIMGYLGFLRGGKSLYLRNVKRYPDLKLHFDLMDEEEAFEYVKGTLLTPEGIKKVYGVDVKRIFEEMDRRNWYESSLRGMQIIATSYGETPPVYVLLDTEKNRKLAVEAVNLIRSSPRMSMQEKG